MKKAIPGVSLLLMCFAASSAMAQNSPEQGYEWRTDASGQYLLVNRGTLRIYGIDPKKVRFEKDQKSSNSKSQNNNVLPGAGDWNIDALTSGSGEGHTADNTVKTRPGSVSSIGHVSESAHQAVRTTYPDATALSPFGPEDKFLQYYKHLKADEKSLYQAIYKALINRLPSVVFGHTIPNEQRIFHAVLADHPEIFWSKNGYSLSVDPNDPNSPMEFEFRYYEFDNGLESAVAEIEQAVSPILAGASQLKTTAEKEKYIYDQLVLHTDYLKGAPYRHSIYSALVQHRALCEGYSRAFQYLMLRLGVPVTYVPGMDGDGGHAWNQIYMDGSCYNVDVTNGGHEPTEKWNVNGRVSTYRKYNVTDKELKENGYSFDYDLGNDEIELPACSSRFSFEDNGYKDLIDTLSRYFPILPGNVVRSMDDYKSMMQKVASQVNTPEFRVYFLVKGKKLTQKISDLKIADNKKLFLEDLWSSKFSKYKTVSTAYSEFQVASDVWVLYVNVKFKN